MKRLVAFLALVGLLFVAVVAIRYTIALAQTGGPYDLSWSTIDGGGHTGSPFGTACGHINTNAAGGEETTNSN